MSQQNGVATAQQNGQVVKNEFKQLFEGPQFQQRLIQIMGKRSGAFTSSVIAVVNGNTKFKDCDPLSIAMAALMAATLDLPVNANLSFAHIIPYGNKAQFQIGWRGFVQLAERTGQYETINVDRVYAGELMGFDRLSGAIKLDESKRNSDDVIGYFAYFKLKTGFEKTVYMNVAQLLEHGKKYSKTFEYKEGKWKTDFDSMAKKTVVKQLLSKWGPLSVDYQLQTAVASDEAIIKDADSKDFDYTPHEEVKAQQIETTTPPENNDQARLHDINNAAHLDMDGM